MQAVAQADRPRSPTGRARRVDATSLTRADALGIEGLCARIRQGESLIKIAQGLGIDQEALHRWVDEDPQRAARARAAVRASAEHWDDEAERLLKDAKDKDDLAKARELAQHYRWRAKVRNPAVYGDKVDISGDIQVTHSRDQVEARLEALVGQVVYSRIEDKGD